MFLRDGKKSTAEIRDYLKMTYGIYEPRGVRLHLEYLCKKAILDKTVKTGIGSQYFWRDDVEGFKNIINMISQNGEVIRNITMKKIVQRSKRRDNLGPYRAKMIQKARNMSVPFDATEFWYDTNYARSFVNGSMLKYFTEKAYTACMSNFQFLEYFRSRGMEDSTREIFEAIMLENHDSQTLLTLMRYSPSLMLYIANLDVECSKRAASMDQRKDIIFQMVLHDNLNESNQSHGGGFFLVPSVTKRFDKNREFEGVDASMTMSFYAEGKAPLLLAKKGKKIRGGKGD